MTPKRKALLLGIIGSVVPLEQRDGAGTQQAIGGSPHDDVRDMRRVLIEIYGYKDKDITMLIDDGIHGHIQPTKEHIIKAMKTLVHGAHPGDRFYFHYSGHGTQLPDDNGDEEDGFDECIVTADDKPIRDDKLKEIMLDRLPAGCSFVSVFDSCNSGTLLDLTHYRCNRVYVPWLSKGVPRVTPAPIVENHTNLHPGHHHHERHPGNHHGHHHKHDHQHQHHHGHHHKHYHSPTTLSAEEAAQDVPVQLDPEDSHPHYCRGGCRTDMYFISHEHQPVADVISLSAAKDYQLSWAKGNESSLTQVLIKILSENPNPSLYYLLQKISHEIHEFYNELHHESHKYKIWLDRKNRRLEKQGKARLEGKKVETENFQDPQISSHRPLHGYEIWQL